MYLKVIDQSEICCLYNLHALTGRADSNALRDVVGVKNEIRSTTSSGSFMTGRAGTVPPSEYRQEGLARLSLEWSG